MEKLEWCGYPTVEKIDDTFTHYDTIHERDGHSERSTDGQADTAKKLNRSDNIPKSFRGLLFFKHPVYNSRELIAYPRAPNDPALFAAFHSNTSTLQRNSPTAVVIDCRPINYSNRLRDAMHDGRS